MRPTHSTLFLSLALLITAVPLGGGLIAAGGNAPARRLIENPIAPIGNDPWVIQKDGIYYYCYSWDSGIWVNANKRLEQVVQFTGKKVWVPEPTGRCSKHVWAPELHFLQGKWYIYFAADDGMNAHHRMFVLEAKTPDPTGPFAFKGQLRLEPDKWAIDGSVLTLRGALYFIWSGWPGDTDVEQDMYIVRMTDPTTTIGKRVLISSPQYAWEKKGRPLVNEGPTALYNGDKVFIVYSASGSWGNHYCLGLLTLTGNDPMQASSWKKCPTPVFSGTASVISPGHASFTKSPDGKEDWIVYHAARHANAGWDRNTRIQPYRWDADGSPVFGRPIPGRVKMAAPAE